MGWRFRKYIQIVPGVRLNISKSGISFTFGKKGASVNVGKDGAYLNTSIPGTGLYNRQKIYSTKKKKSSSKSNSKDFNKEECQSTPHGFTNPPEQIMTFHNNDSKTKTDNVEPKNEKRLDETRTPNKGCIDSMLYDVAVYIVSNQSCNVSIIQKKFVISQYKTSRIVDQLEQMGVVKRSPQFRIDVLVKDLESLDSLFEKLSTKGISTSSTEKVEEDQKKENNEGNKIQVNCHMNNTHSIGFIDPKLFDVADIVVREQSCETSSIQRKLALGFGRTSRIIDQLEQIGVVKRLQNNKKEVLIKDSASLDLLFANLQYDGISENIFGITEDYYNDIIVIVHSLVQLYQEIKKDVTIMYAISDCLPDNYGNKEQKLAALFHADIMKVHQHFGHSTTNLKNREGFPLVVLSSLILGGDHSLDDLKFWNINKLEDLSRTIPAVFSSLCHIFDQYPDDNFFFIGQILSRCRRRSFYTRYFTLLYRLFSFIAKADGSITENEATWLNKLLDLNPQKANVNIVFNVKETPINNPVASQTESKKQETQKQEPSKHVSKPIEELNNLIGLSNVKTEITSLSNLVKVQQARKNRGMSVSNISYHCVFTGNPGTGKTTVARIVAEIYKELGVLKKGHLVETDRSGLVGEYVGQTAPKTNAIIDSALDGVLFIDEAYSLVQGGQNDFGKEAISTLLKRMEDDRDRLIIILAGYSKEMGDFINANSGLQSRFNRYIEFPDYSSTELVQIFNYIVKKNDYYLTEGASVKVESVIEDAVRQKEANFGNARFVRNLFEKIIIQQANRITSEPKITNEMLVRIEEIDIINSVK